MSDLANPESPVINELEHLEGVEESRKLHIPEGSTVPHPDDWKGVVSRVENEFQNKPIALRNTVMVTTPKGNRVRRVLTNKQLKAMHYLTQGYSKRQALLKAGYSKATANIPSRVLKQQSMVALMETMGDSLEKAGLTKDFVASKMKEWMEAKKVDLDKYGVEHAAPDYETQIKAYDRWKDVNDGNNPSKGLKRKMTIEEFVDKEESESNV